MAAKISWLSRIGAFLSGGNLDRWQGAEIATCFHPIRTSAGGFCLAADTAAPFFFGFYIGRDGPPGYNHYAPPAYILIVNFAVMGHWQAGDRDLLQRLEPLIDTSGPLHVTDWQKMTTLMRKRLAKTLSTNK